MVLVFFGTIEQKDIGLFASQKIFYKHDFVGIWHSFARWFAHNDYSIYELILIFSQTQFMEKNKVGILTVHIGALILLIGSGITRLV